MFNLSVSLTSRSRSASRMMTWHLTFLGIRVAMTLSRQSTNSWYRLVSVGIGLPVVLVCSSLSSHWRVYCPQSLWKLRLYLSWRYAGGITSTGGITSCWSGHSRRGSGAVWNSLPTSQPTASRPCSSCLVTTAF